MKKYKIIIRVYEDTVKERYEYSSDTEEAVKNAFVCLDEDGIYLESIETIKDNTVKSQA